MMYELVDAFDRIDADDDVRVVIVTGAGRGFCAGADLSSGGDTFSGGGSDVKTKVEGVPRDGGGIVSLRIFECTKPVIAAINGPAVGVGITMTLPMDIRLASENAKFGFVFARRGILPEACSSYFLPRLVGISQATEWCYTGRVFGPDEAKDGRLVRSVHAPDDLLPAARAIAKEIVDNTAPVSVALTARCCGVCSGPTIRWRPTRWIRAASPSAARVPIPRGRDELPREACTAVPGEGERRAARHLPRLGTARVQLTPVRGVAP
ncbi:MAG: enoyl-CoA hydratase-related protein [Ilumatobacteraceae bacterium]